MILLSQLERKSTESNALEFAVQEFRSPFSILIDFRSDFSKTLGSDRLSSLFWMFRNFIFIFFCHERLFQKLIVYENLEIFLIRIASHEEEVHILAAQQLSMLFIYKVNTVWIRNLLFAERIENAYILYSAPAARSQTISTHSASRFQYSKSIPSD